MSTADQGGSKTDIAPAPNPTNWKAAILQWAAAQGVSTVLLLLGAAGAWRAAPYVISEFKALAKEHAATEKEQRDAFTLQLGKAYEVGATRDKDTRDEILAELRRISERNRPAN